MSAQTIQQLESARSLALGDGRYYPTIIPGVLPIIGYNAETPNVEVQRWGAEFLAEAFASPTWPPDAKENSVLSVLATLKGYLENAEDTSVVKCAIQAAASVYPLVYKHIVSDPSDSQNWQIMTAIKSNILRRMDTAPPGVRICCVKFLQQIVLVQTPGVVDPRRPDHSDVSLALVPRDHPLMPSVSLEAEGQGLLDRLLGVIHGDHSDGLLVTAALNTLGLLIHRRPAIATKILNSVLSFNPLKLANSPMTPKNKVIIKSIERTTRALFMNLMRRHPENPVNGRLQQFLERVHRTRVELFDESNRKRPAPAEPTDGFDQAKRQRLTAGAISQKLPATNLPTGPISLRELFTLNPEGSTVNFDVKNFKDFEQLLRILVPVYQSVDAVKLDQAVNVVRGRYLTLSQAIPRSAPALALPAEDEEEYEPDFEPEDAEQISNKLDGAPNLDQPLSIVSTTAPAPYKLPDAPPLSEQEAKQYGDLTINRAFGMLSSIDENQRNQTSKGGFNRLAASNYGREAWVTILSRIATRASAGLDDPDAHIKDEFAVKSMKDASLSISDSIRDGLYQYIVYDWKKRIDVAISWLNEEWYNDFILSQSPSFRNHLQQPNYPRLALRLFDGILPYIEHTDKKTILRFLSEIPALSAPLLARVKTIADDPERVDLACSALQYLYMFRPPVRGLVVQVLADLWRENERAKPVAAKLLKKWAPDIVAAEEGPDGRIKMETGSEMIGVEIANGTSEVKAAS